jgi:hypothetical protein
VIASAIYMLTGLITNYQNSTPRCPPNGDSAFKCDFFIFLFFNPLYYTTYNTTHAALGYGAIVLYT